MKTSWKDQAGEDKTVVSPVSLVVSAAAPVYDIRNNLLPMFAESVRDSSLLLMTSDTAKIVSAALFTLK